MAFKSGEAGGDAMYSHRAVRGCKKNGVIWVSVVGEWLEMRGCWWLSAPSNAHTNMGVTCHYSHTLGSIFRMKGHRKGCKIVYSAQGLDLGKGGIE